MIRKECQLEVCGSKACEWKCASIIGIVVYHIKFSYKHSLLTELSTDLVSMYCPIHWNGTFSNWSVVWGWLVCLPNLNIRNRFDQSELYREHVRAGNIRLIQRMTGLY